MRGGRRAALLAFVKKERWSLLTAEALFLLVFAAWALYRAYDPAIAATEQPMDFGFLNASVHTYLGEPEDPWLRGESISYYYFGYWMMGSLAKLTGIHTAIAYNLSLALIPALAAMGIFSLVAGMVRSDSKGLRYALTAGLAAAALLVLAANLEGVLEFMRANGLGSAGFWQWLGVDGLDEPLPALAESWRPQEHLWWWRATRTIGFFDGDTTLDYTIHEFPFFSFILGDLHPHVMSIPFVVAFLTMLWAYLRSPHQAWPLSRAAFAGDGRASLASLGRSAAAPAAMGLVLGALAFNNMWDLPVFAALLVGVAGVRAYSARPDDAVGLIERVASAALPVIALALVLIAPYLVSFGSQVSGIGAVGVYTTRPPHLLIVWGLFLLAVAPAIVSVFWRTTVDRDWRLISVVSLSAGFLPFVAWVVLSFGGDASPVARLIWVLPLALLISAAVFAALWLSKQSDPQHGLVFALMLAALGLLLIMGPELLHVDDSFGGAWERMNTVFKLYYQAWILLSAAAGYAIFHMLKLRDGAVGGKLILTRVWLLALVVLLACSAYYPLAAAATKGDPQGRDPTLDGLAHLPSDERAAIEFIRNDAGRDSAVLEAFGDDYTPFGRISSSTGCPRSSAGPATRYSGAAPTSLYRAGGRTSRPYTRRTTWSRRDGSSTSMAWTTSTLVTGSARPTARRALASSTSSWTPRSSRAALQSTAGAGGGAEGRARHAQALGQRGGRAPAQQVARPRRVQADPAHVSRPLAGPVRAPSCSRARPPWRGRAR